MTDLPILKQESMSIPHQVLPSSANEREALINQVLTASHCLLWDATIVEWPILAESEPPELLFDPEKKTGLSWEMHFLLPHVVQRWLPIAWSEGQSFEDAFYEARHPEDRRQLDQMSHQALRRGDDGYVNQYRIRCSDGTWRWLQEKVSITPISPGRWRAVGTSTDITELKSTQETLEHVLQSAHCLIWNASIERCPIPYDDPNECQAARDQGMWETGTYFAWDIQIFAEDTARHWLPVLHEHDQPYDEAIYAAITEEDRIAGDRTSSEALLTGKSSYSQEFRIHSSDGTLRCLQEDVHLEPRGPGRWYAVGINLDITHRKRIEQQLVHQAQHDPLTGLANRRHLQEALEHRAPKAKPALLFLDLDNFKLINDNFGHLMGDQVLVHVARCLQRVVGGSGLVARLGGDEFTIFLPDVPDPTLVQDLADRLLQLLAAPLPLQERPLLLSASIGIALAETSTTDLLRNANTAMHYAKSEGKAHFAFFSPRMDQQARDRFEMELALREAVQTGQIVAYYQPIIDLNSQNVVAVEALARWQNQDGSFLSPAQFIPVAEETGLILPLGTSLLRSACQDMVAWRKRFPHLRLHVNVNVSERQFRQPEFATQVQEAFQETGLPPDFLTLELTESILLSDSENCLAKLHQLEKLGIRLILDDFGTGYSSLSYLSRLPVKALKIDRSFISALSSSDPKTVTQSEAIVRTILALAQTLQLEVTAEGIEQHSQQLRLATLGANYGQGYYFARPMPAAALTEYLERTSLPTLSLAA